MVAEAEAEMREALVAAMVEMVVEALAVVMAAD